MTANNQTKSQVDTAEHIRLESDRLGKENWRRWGPYVSERAWGTVREDYSSDGEAWDYLTHDQARSKAYRWGEDGIAGICDRYQLLVFSLAFWNEHDPFLKERLFGVVPKQSNHGEDVREYYYYLDATPTHSYLKFLYKYPHRAFPYQQLVAESQQRKLEHPEYELLDTGIFDDNRYFDIVVEYAKVDEEDICIKVEIINRAKEAAKLHCLPQLCFRNTWSWGAVPGPAPTITNATQPSGPVCLLADDSTAEPLTNLLQPYELGARYFYAEVGGQPLFTNNESNCEVLYQSPSRTPYNKDAFHRYVVNGEQCVNPEQTGSKACVHYSSLEIAAEESLTLRFRLSHSKLAAPLDEVEGVVRQRKREADEFYAKIHPPLATLDERLVQRQAFAGMIWTKQFYMFDVRQWLEGDNPAFPPPINRQRIRNTHWKHLNSMRILTMPDKWEYPWFAAWDLAFQCIPFAIIDPEFAKEQLWLLLFEQFQHSNGQIPAYEWEFSDLNPPVHAWAVWRVYNMDRLRTGRADREFLEKCFHKLLLNFTWWVNKVDAEGNNVFEGGFLGLDNITTFDRSKPPDDGSSLKQADATGWMGMYCLNLMRIALELAKENQSYVGLATKFFEHYIYIGSAMKNMGGRNFQLWSQMDGLFYDVLVYPDGSYHRFRLRSLVSLIPLYATERLEEVWASRFPEFKANLDWFLRNRPELTEACLSTCENKAGKVHLLSLVNRDQLSSILKTLCDENEFLSPFGLRSLSKHHAHAPFTFGGQTVRYDPAESTTWLKGGNSNWRGPVWFPTAFLMIESLRKLAKVYGETLEVECKQTDGTVSLMSLSDIASQHANRLIKLFTRNDNGQRPIFGSRKTMQDDPHWRDNLLFHEYFNAETGEGLGANHQTGWTGLVASLIDEWRR